MRTKIILGVFVALLVIQAIRPAKNTGGPVNGKDDFIVKFAPPADVAQVLRVACYDCHSNVTRYPWYAEVQPVGWWLAEHVNDGKHDLNLSEFGTYAATRQARKLNQMSDQLANRKMPLASYTLIHRNARLTDAQVDAVSAWLDDLHDKIAQP